MMNMRTGGPDQEYNPTSSSALWMWGITAHWWWWTTLIRESKSCWVKVIYWKLICRYPSGRKSSQQYVVGCVLHEDKRIHEGFASSQALWEILDKNRNEKMGWDFYRSDSQPMIKNQTFLHLNNWKFMKNLNSHLVAAPLSPSRTEVTVLSRIVKFDRIPNILGSWKCVKYWILNIFGFLQMTKHEYQMSNTGLAE